MIIIIESIINKCVDNNIPQNKITMIIIRDMVLIELLFILL